jgi:YesN/AraC family two-component response regulator
MDDNDERENLLIIEDNEEMRDYIRHCIDQSKYRITEACNGEEGVDKALATIPDLIVSDVMMPKKDGFQVLEEIRGNMSTSHIPLVLLTAKSSLESRLKGLHRGADGYLTKPFSPQELVLRIGRLVEVRKAMQERYKIGAQEIAEQATVFKKEDVFITQLREQILTNMDRLDLNGDFLGKSLGMSRVHLHRKLKALTDQSISQYVKDLRLEKALHLIKEGELNFSEITYEVGFSSVSHFSKVFKKQYGRTPSEMKQAVRNNEK